ncbi:MAG: IS630 family transposase [Zoogloeaceae bacterium]|nr:IS630 family transposase [Zoogloeaceae bacterium]
MKREDMRSLSFEAREERRRQVVGLRRRGWTYEAIAEETGLSRTGVFNICQRHAQEGTPGPKDKQGGRKVGDCRSLSAEQEAEIRKLICDKTPDQLTMAFALWNRQAVRHLIVERYGVALTPQGVGKYLARWGFTPQKPIKRAYEQRPELVQAWLTDTYPQIAQRAKAEGAEIHWGDETGLRPDDVRGRSYAPAGKTSEIRVMNRREGLSVMSTVTNRGKVRWKVFEGAMNADILIEFMKRLIKDTGGKKVFLILDNLKVHHAKPDKAWLAEHATAIEVFYLPSYSPELNPDEMLNADLKAVVTSKATARAKGDLKRAKVSHLRRLQKSPARVMRYFQHGPVR